MKTKSLFFDLDGTLANPLRAFSSSMRHAFEAKGLASPTESQLRRCIGPPLRRSLLEILGVGDPVTADELLALYREHHARECERLYEFYPGAREAIQRLKSHFELYVVTSKPWSFARPIISHFHSSGDVSPFREVYGPELNGLHDDKADLIRHVLAQEGIVAVDAVMIGDRLHDIVAAKKNGVRSMGVLWGYGSREELEQAGAESLVSDYSELVPERLMSFWR